MLLAMSMVAMVVVLMAVAVYAVVSRALYDDIDNQLHSRARLLIESGSLAADPGKAIEGTAYSDVNAMLVNPGRAIYTANQEGQTLPLGEPEKDVVSGELLMSLRTANQQRVLAVHLENGSSLLISKSLAPTGEVLKRLGTVLLITGVSLYTLFVNEKVKMPGLLQVNSFDDLKINLVAVVIVVMAQYTPTGMLV